MRVALQDDLDTLNAGLNRRETIKKFAVLPRETSPTIHADAQSWRAWLPEHHPTSRGVWLCGTGDITARSMHAW